MTTMLLQEISPGLVETEFMTRGKGEEVAKKFFKSIEVSFYFEKKICTFFLVYCQLGV